MKKISADLMWQMYENFKEAKGEAIGIKERVAWEENCGEFVDQPPCKVINKIQKYRNDYGAMLASFKVSCEEN
jgi:hypothetical protein